MDRAIFEFIIFIMKFSAGECLGFIITGLDYFSISEDLSTTRTILYCVVITVCRVQNIQLLLDQKILFQLGSIELKVVLLRLGHSW